MILRIFAISVSALVAGSFIEHARAGQFFVCDDGTAIEIETPQLEHAKRTIPCVAKHYGLDIQPRPKPADQVRSEPEAQARPTVEVSKTESHGTEAAQPDHAGPTTAAAPANVVIPVRKPARPELRETDTKPVPSGRQGKRLIADVANPADGRVRIINARPGAAKWFHVKH